MWCDKIGDLWINGWKLKPNWPNKYFKYEQVSIGKFPTRHISEDADGKKDF